MIDHQFFPSIKLIILILNKSLFDTVYRIKFLYRNFIFGTESPITRRSQNAAPCNNQKKNVMDSLTKIVNENMFSFLLGWCIAHKV